MIASLTADALQISSVICQMARPTQRTVVCSHLIEYATERARYAGSDASALFALRSCCVLGTGAFRGRWRVGVRTRRSMPTVNVWACGYGWGASGAVGVAPRAAAGSSLLRGGAAEDPWRG